MTANNSDTKEKREEASGAERIIPYGADGHKGEQVEKMFDSIAPAYDFMNTAMTFGLHKMWSRSALRQAFASVELNNPATSGRTLEILDVATGTGDLVFKMAREHPSARIFGVDLSEGMLKVARAKYEAMDRSTRGSIRFEQGDCLNLPYADSSFDLITVAYGVRNFERLEEGLREMCRVLRPGGTICILELSRPVNPIARLGYDIYSRCLIPIVGRMVSGDSDAYSYLPKSIAAAPQRDDLTALMTRSGFGRATWRSLTFGAVCVYLGIRN
ncbi:MAG: bifunctional demethylmenaquinone methyltransferase/2-methoxy-6-polyprenyl-1,4-benzoquinol methylase UbiE [Muribaculum sp.]|nr:bifunctional demethylmenaquinone methyltransferase/2-methoxy-6-polyprenyl-1,4-benzoquinol methylase UbiE [Muribaculum sp.]